MDEKKVPGTQSGFNGLRSITRLIICVVIAAVFYILVPFGHLDGFTRVLAAWDIFSLCLTIFSWITFLTARPNDIRTLAKVQDESRSIIFVIVLVSTVASLLAVLLLLVFQDSGRLNEALHLIISISGMALSWILVHTIFTLRYAHMYYGDSDDQPSNYAGGLDFPGDERPDYVDFAYFSFVLGMTFQVSDVEVTSRRIRRLALLHGILAFCFNTIIVALTINVIAGLRK